MELKSFPAAYSSINDFLLWVVYDANSIDPTKTDYKYVGELWIDGMKVYTSRVYPRPDGSFGVFDFSSIIRGYVSPPFKVTGDIDSQEMTPSQWCTKPIVVKIREEYDGTVGAVVLTDNTRRYFNQYNGRINGFTALAEYTDSPASTRPRTIELVRTATSYFISYFAEAATTFNVMFTIDGTAYTKTVSPTVANTMQVLNISPGAINAEFTGALTAAHTSYTVSINGEVYTVNIACPGIYTNYVLHFMNKFGGYESMLFNKPRKRIFESIEKKEFRQLPYRINTLGVVTVGENNILHEQGTVFAVSYNEKLKVQTDLLTDEEYIWLSQLVVSPLIYLEDNLSFYPVKIISSDYDFREHVIDRLTSLSLDLDFTAPQNTQYR